MITTTSVIVHMPISATVSVVTVRNATLIAKGPGNSNPMVQIIRTEEDNTHPDLPIEIEIRYVTDTPKGTLFAGKPKFGYREFEEVARAIEHQINSQHGEGTARVIVRFTPYKPGTCFAF